MAPGPQLVLEGLDGSLGALHGLREGPPPPQGEGVYVRHHHCRLAARWGAGPMLHTGLQGGTDAATKIPSVRFDVDTYWVSDPAELGLQPMTVQRHTSYVEGVDLFDGKY